MEIEEGWVGVWGGGRNHQHCPILARKIVHIIK
jgi:hypothetical protein